MKKLTSNSWTPDPTQQKIIDIHSGNHLVLAPPGCGKTQILAERIYQALALGVKPEQMLCLTFTNRAARGMKERINERVGENNSQNIFVGNVHRFCSRFLFSNGIVPAESAIIDDDTTNSILARYLNEDEERVEHDFRRKRTYQQIMFFSHFMYDLEHNLPKELRMHPECVTREDIAVMKAIAKSQDKPFDASLMIDIYNHTDYYLNNIVATPPSASKSITFSFPSYRETLLKMRYAHAYTAYKRLNNLLDFEDLLQLTYTALKTTKGTTTYPWIQVDEVQDLNMLQLAIISLLSPNGIFLSFQGVSGRISSSCCLFLGDEQQAIFSFMGAKLATLNVIKECCKGNIHHLGVNHRCPKLLLEMLNAYAISNLGSDPSLLPLPAEAEENSECLLSINKSDNIFAEFNSVAKLAKTLGEKHPADTTAIIVNSNKDADEISKLLDKEQLSYFKISGTDMFSTPDVKLLLAHLSVLENDHNFLAWSRIMKGMKVCETAASARQFVHQLRKVAITPSDFFTDAYLQRFVNTYETSDIIVFDTETTGLDVYNDDIIQIAAERIRQGKSVAKFSVYIETEKEIPAMLGDIVNPIIEERKHQHIYTHEEGLQKFLDFVNGCPLLAHNAEFDRHILEYNLKRYMGTGSLHSFKNGQEDSSIPSLDSLKLIRIIRPDLHAYKLKVLLSELGLEGENSHLADDDVNATVSLVNYCYEKGKEILPLQKEFLSRKTTQERILRLQRNYGEYYKHGISALWSKPQDSKQKTVDTIPPLAAELRYFYHSVEDLHWIKPIPKIDYIFRYIANDLLANDCESSLKEQLENKMMEINTLKEADLCGSSTMEDKLFVSTIHKAKGLEFDNVIVFDVVDGRIPNFYNEGNPELLAEDARKLYVALSRAKKRLFVCYSKQGLSSATSERKLSRFMTSVSQFFNKK